MTFTLVGLRDDGAGERAPDGRPIDQPAGGDEGVRRGRNRDGHDRDAGHRHVAHRVRDDDRPGDDRHDPDSRPQVRGPADAHARRQRRPGPRRRRDLVCRPARRLQQHQSRRRRLQQRVLRRAGRRAARVDRHHARCHQGVPGHRQRRACRIRPHGRRCRQRHHQVGHELDAGERLLLPAPGGTHRRPLRRLEARRLPPRAVRRHDWRADQEGQGVLLSRRWKGSTATSSVRI